MARLDKSRPYTQVYGIADHAFEQGGKLFDHEGKELEAKGAPAPAVVVDGLDAFVAELLNGSAAHVTEQLAGLSDAQLAAVRAQEIGGKTRKGLMAAIDAEIARRAPEPDQVDEQLNG